jgi:hypothetical protein
LARGGGFAKDAAEPVASTKYVTRHMKPHEADLIRYSNAHYKGTPDINWERDVMITNRPAPFFPKDRSHVVGPNMIHMVGADYKDDYGLASETVQGTFVHEGFHVVQATRNPLSYLLTMSAEWSRFGDPGVYKYGAQGFNIKTDSINTPPFEALTLEAQAAVIEDLYLRK